MIAISFRMILILAVWIAFGTKIPMLASSILLLNAYPRHRMAEDLLANEQVEMIAYSQLMRLVHSKKKVKEIVSVTDDVIGDRNVWIVEFRNGKKKIVLVPRKAADLDDVFARRHVLLYAADADAPFRWSQGMIVANLLNNPRVLLTPWWWH